ncbi:MAG: DNA primase [Candidatus Omnitrophota bacterium]
MSRISGQILEEIQSRCDIVDVISSYIPLKKIGSNFKACCPFHHEKTPSFVVSQNKQIFHCFGCGLGGDIFSFVMKHERLEFPDAVKMLAEKAGVSVVLDKQNEASQDGSLTKLLYRINELASAYFQNTLLNDAQAAKARHYIEKRQISPESIKSFAIGYSGEQWEGLLSFLRKKGVNDSLIIQSGLVVKNSQGKLYDRFRERLMFPIFNSQGKIIGFGGRILDDKSAKTPERQDDKKPKYINSPETEIYKKSKNLYGFNFSKQFVTKQNYCVVVEGYLDFIIPFQFGVKNLVASLGTAFTPEHVRLLKRYTQNIVIVFDSDAAGQEAALRSLDLLLEEGMNVRIANLDPGFDPDSWVCSHGAESFNEVINAAKSLFDFKLDLLLSKFDRKIPEHKAQIAHQMLLTIKKVKNAIVRESYLKRLSEVISVTEEALLAELSKLRDFSVFDRKEASLTGGKAENKHLYQAERMLLSLIIDDARLVREVKQKLNIDEFKDPLIKKIAGYMFDNEDLVGPTKILNKINDQEITSFISRLMVDDLAINDRQRSFDDCIGKIKKDEIQNRIKFLQRELKVASDESITDSLLKEIGFLKKEQKAYEKGQ